MHNALRMEKTYNNKSKFEVCYSLLINSKVMMQVFRKLEVGVDLNVGLRLLKIFFFIFHDILMLLKKFETLFS